MLKATDQERTAILEYMASQAADETVSLTQKLHVERVGSTVHEVWDVRTGTARWWVITSPTNLYSQEQFPNMDLALTFHVGLCLRIPRTHEEPIDDQWAEPFMACARGLDDAREALTRAEEVEDFQAIGMRTREVLISLASAAQVLIAKEVPEPQPKGSDVVGWTDAMGDLLFAGSTNAHRRSLAKKSAKEAWDFSNWLTHARGAGPHDAEAAIEATALAVGVYTTALIRRARGVPERCPECASHKLSPERASDPADPESTYERPACSRCAWRGAPVLVRSKATTITAIASSVPATDDCVVMSRPLLSTGPRRRSSARRKR